MIFCTNAFATSINLTNSTESVVTDTLDKVNGTDYFADETTNVWQDGEIIEEARVTVSRTSQFEITIPKEVVLDGSTGTADYKVKAKGDIAGDQKIIVTPDANFTLSEAGGKDNITAIITQPDTEYVYTDLQGEGTEHDGNISATLSAGEWSGKFNFNIEFKASSGPVLPAKAAFNDMSWADIATVSEAGKASEYFTVGDEKELIISEYSYYDADTKTIITHPETTYHVQILGFNHDNLSDNSGKAGITVGLKETMVTRHVMNSTATNVGGWRDSEMRTYINNIVYNNLPFDLKPIVKTVNKISDNGNKDKITLNTTQDKLFLLSIEEIGLTSNQTTLVEGQGTKYEYFIDETSNMRELYCWHRTTHLNNITSFYCLYGFSGIVSSNARASYANGVVFAFCI